MEEEGGQEQEQGRRHFQEQEQGSGTGNTFNIHSENTHLPSHYIHYYYYSYYYTHHSHTSPSNIHYAVPRGAGARKRA